MLRARLLEHLVEAGSGSPVTDDGCPDEAPPRPDDGHGLVHELAKLRLGPIGVVRAEADDDDGSEPAPERPQHVDPLLRGPADTVVRIHPPARKLVAEVRLDPDVE